MDDSGETATGQLPLMGTLLRVPYSVLGEAVEQGLHDAGYGDIHRSHLTVLQPLFTYPDGARPTDLAAWAHMTKPSMGYLVNHLEARGYVERVPDPTDKRAQQVRLTARGQAAVQTVRSLVVATEMEWAALIGPERLEQLRQILRELGGALRGNGAESW